MEFDPMRSVMFRGTPLPELNQQEALEALCLALKRVHYLETVGDERHRGGRGWGIYVGFAPVQL